MRYTIWPYASPGIPDQLFERLPGIPLTTRETRLLILSQLRLDPQSIIWDIGAGTGTIPVEVGRLCPQSHIVAIERDEEVAALIQKNCDRFQVSNVEVIGASAPQCLAQLKAPPHRVCIEGGRSFKEMMTEVWRFLRPGGRVVATASSLEHLYNISETFAQLQARNIEVVQSVINRLENRGIRQTFSAVDPIFILSGEKMEP
ncbi:precorrin-6Y C5,15-methyltransferase subunit CbiT [Lyngbya confervoides]|uniref:Precorrin-6Y C5,15-methyltransferase subunit CbiT n=1 Tax=Lyngbya confervoides BDU141951 TaxID=1574623 RepID=A0ABD4T6B1_9CYAN|nr:precorrin-6Y C5,15-methyltransferase subunit CbiT [Lyngbya confervoides]MCM1984166.1 precorrin-6Y C5,15-methyltransferase subunit CbiT [Lyngbya confervoides BDU141951]